jgi:hypothetical protein
LCFANHTDHKKTDGIPIAITKSNGSNGVDRSSSIAASINEHYLTINFLTDIGHVWIKVTDVSGVTLDLEYSETPTGYVYYIPSAGHYVLVITLWDGDVYEGEFDVVN